MIQVQLVIKKGGFILAINGMIPIMPTSISGTRHIYPKGGKILKPGTVKIKFLNEISPKNFGYEKRNDLVNYTRQQIINAYEPDFNRRN